MVQFLTKVEESRLKIIENNRIKVWCLSLNLRWGDYKICETLAQ
jgi:hypothetical protein